MAPQYIPPPSSLVEQLVASRELAEGQVLVGGYDITKPLDVSAFSKVGKDNVVAEFRRLGISVGRDDNGRYTFDKPVYLQDLIEGDFNWKYFSPQFATDLRNTGLLRGDKLQQPIYDRFTAGTLPAAKDLRAGLTERAFGLLGLAEPGVTGGPGDIVGQAGLAQLQQDIRGAYAARGLGSSGQAAFFEGTQGINFLEGLRQSRQQEGLGILSGIYPEIMPATALGLATNTYNQQLFQNMFNIQQSQIERGLHRADLATNRAQEQQYFAMAFGLGTQGAQVGLSGYNAYNRAQQPGGGQIGAYGYQQNPYGYA